MKIITFAQILALSGMGIGLSAGPGFADQDHCRHIGGGILTNFLDPSTCGGPTGLCSDGTATGDLKGAIGVGIASAVIVIAAVALRWVCDGKASGTIKCGVPRFSSQPFARVLSSRVGRTAPRTLS